LKIAVTGATGNLGRIVIEKLKAQGSASDIIALVRSPEKAADPGVAMRAADYSRPETLDGALVGVGRLLLISSSELGQRVAQHRNVIEAAQKAGVQHIVYTSVLHADMSPLSLAAEHLETETALKASGAPFTILRNGWYSENYTGSIGGALAGGSFIGSAGEGKISGAARRDYAEAAVSVLSGTGHEGKTYELAGDTAWTLSDLTAEISKQIGKEIHYENLSEADYGAVLVGLGLPEGLATAIAGWDAGASQDALFDDGKQLSALIGRPTTPLSVSVAEAIKG
jgi:NAD(P)H dehydrogenase (quinone)